MKLTISFSNHTRLAIYSNGGDIMPKKILYALQGIGMGGVSSVILNYYRMLKESVTADFVVVVPPEHIPSVIREELEQQGCRIFHVTPFVKSMKKYRQEISQIIAEGNYDIIHDNDKYFAFLTLGPAKKYGVLNRICHVHNTVAANEKKMLHRLFIKFSSMLSVRYATTLLACSEEAGRSMFGNHVFKVLNNAINPENFRFDENKRITLREKLGLQNSFVIIMVARNDGLKRYDFAFQVFSELYELRDDAAFVVVGMSEEECAGRDRDALESLTEEKRNRVFLLGRRLDANDLLNVADAFILTSEHEGFGISIIEAQANGLQCFVSDAIPQATKCTDLVSFLPTVKEPEKWAVEISRACSSNRKEYNDIIANGEFSIAHNKTILESVYGVK